MVDVRDMSKRVVGMKTQVRSLGLVGLRGCARRSSCHRVWLVAFGVTILSYSTDPALGQIPPDEPPAASLGYPTYGYKYYVQPTIRRVNSRKSCRGEYSRAGVFSPRAPQPPETPPGSPTSVTLGYREQGAQIGCSVYTCNEPPPGCPYGCDLGSPLAAQALFHEVDYPTDRFSVAFRNHGQQSWNQGSPSGPGARNFQLAATPAGIQRGGVANYERQWAYPWTCDDGGSGDPCDHITSGYFHGEDGYKLRVKIQSDPSFGPWSDRGSPTSSGSSATSGVLFALAGEPGACCDDPPFLNVGRLAFEAASGQNAVRGPSLTYYGYDAISEWTIIDLFSFRVPGKALLSNQTIPSHGWSSSIEEIPSPWQVGDTLRVRITDGDGFHYRFESVTSSPLSRIGWTDVEVSVKNTTHGPGEDPVADYVTTNGVGTNGLPDGTSRVVKQNDPNSDACIKYLYDENNRLAAVVGCADCNDCDPEQCDPDIRRLDVEYDEFNRLIGWSGGCGGCGSFGQTLTYCEYIPTLGDLQPVKSRLDAEGNAIVIYHYDDANEVSAVYRGSDDVNSAGLYLIVKETKDFVTTNGINTNGIDTNGVVARYTKLYVANTDYEYIFEAYRDDGLIGARTVWSGLNGTGTTCTTRFVHETGPPEREVTIHPRGNYTYEEVGSSGGNEGVVVKYARSDGSNEKMVELFEYVAIRGAPYTGTATNPYGGTTEYEYDDHALLTHRKDPAFGDFGASSGKRFEVEYQYDDWLQLTKEIRTVDGSTNVETEYQYDMKGRMTTQIEDAAAGGLQLTTAYEHSPFNEITKVTDPRGVERHHVYCSTGQLVQEYTLALQGSNALEETQYEYDTSGRLTLVKVADDDTPFTPGDPAGWFETEYEYDIYGRRTKMIVKETLETTYEYDNQNRVVKTTTPGEVWTKIERDGRGLQTAQVIGYDETEYLRTEYEYDANGNLTKIEEPSGRTTTYEYDMFDRRTKATVDDGT